MSYIFGGNTGVASPEELKRRRALAEALVARNVARAPQNIGEGIAALGGGLAARALLNRVSEQEKAGRIGALDAYNAALGSGGVVSVPAAEGDASIIDAIISQESGGDPNAISPKGATGLMQIMPDTARDPGFGVRPFDPSKPLNDPEENKRFGTDYFNAMRKRYDGSVNDALIAYNAGPGVADKFAAGGRNMANLPQETQDYVKSINARMGRQSAQPRAQSIDPRIAQALANPYMPTPQKAVLQAMLDQQLKASAPLEPTNAMREAQSLGVPLDQYYRMKGEATRPQTTVNVGQSQYGKIPPGYQLVRDPETKALSMSPIPGGPAAADAREKAAKAEQRQEQAARYGDIVTEDVGRAIDLVKNATVPVAGFGALLQDVPGTPARNAKALIDTIRANVGFDKLQSMREASPTGGALGQVSNLENRLMQATIGNLEQSQSEEQLLYNLNRVRDTYLDIIHGPGNRPAPETTKEELPEGVSEDDVVFTMEKHGLTRDQVLERLRNAP